MARSSRSSNKGLILLVDDETSILVTLAMLLEEEGYQVMTAEHGRNGLAQLSRSRPDLIITDYMMPYLSGAELIREVRAQANWATIPILLMSAALPADIDPDDLHDAFLHKPVDLDELLSLIEQLINA